MERERGSASVVMVAVLTIVLVVAGAVAMVGRVANLRAQVSGAADLAALAGARAGDCGNARRVAEANHTELMSCRMDGLDVIVQVTAERGVLPYLLVRSSARAGPP